MKIYRKTKVVQSNYQQYYYCCCCYNGDDDEDLWCCLSCCDLAHINEMCDPLEKGTGEIQDTGWETYWGKEGGREDYCQVHIPVHLSTTLLYN